MNVILRLEGPMMSFGGVKVDGVNITDRFPARSGITGLCANALGYHRLDYDRLDSLQERLSIAARVDRPGVSFVDFQTADLSEPEMQSNWTSAGVVEGRRGGKPGTHIRHRHYLADSSYTVALTLTEPKSRYEPTLAQLIEAFTRPARPLFLGRKCCVPTRPLLIPGATMLEGTLLDALIAAPLSTRAASHQLAVRVPKKFESDPRLLNPRQAATAARCDWRNQLHVGRTIVIEAQVDLRQGKESAA